MSEKYEDLASRISDDLEPTMAGEAYIRNSLRWLDQNRDQAPGRTMPESEMEHKCATYGSAYETGFRQAGGVVIPDPEPTNAEKLAHYVRQMDLTPMSPNECGKWLDEQGVKAPGGDDE